MPSGFSNLWLITWSLWALVVLLDCLREPRDWRWVVSLSALVGVAVATRDTLREPDIRFVLLTGLAVAVLLAWGASRLLARRRHAKTAAWARLHGFEPIAIGPRRADVTLPEGLRRLPLIARGAFAKTEGVLRRDEPAGGEVLAFQFAIRRRMAWYGPSGVEARGTVVALRRPGLWLPFFQVRPDGLFDWFDGGPVGDPVAITPGSAFARGYRLTGHEPRNLRGLFPDEMLDAIARSPAGSSRGKGSGSRRWCSIGRTT